MADSITETCSCGASITVPLVPHNEMYAGQRLTRSGLTDAQDVVKDWRTSHRCTEPTTPVEPAAPPKVHAIPAADTSRAPQWDFDRRPPVRLGFRPNEERAS